MVQIGIIGDSRADERLCRLAEEVGGLLARKGWTIICGGLSGVMEAAARGARAGGGLTVGVLPGSERHEANRFIDVALATGLGHARNAVIACSADAFIAIGGGWGTLSEIALARKMGKTVVSLSSWEVSPEIERASTPQEALQLIEKALDKVRRPSET